MEALNVKFSKWERRKTKSKNMSVCGERKREIRREIRLEREVSRSCWQGDAETLKCRQINLSAINK